MHAVVVEANNHSLPTADVFIDVDFPAPVERVYILGR